MTVVPVIGIAAAVERARWGSWDTRAHLLSADYASAVERAGGLPWLVPPTGLATDSPELVVGRLDGLILAGGVDVTPDSYGAPRNPLTDAGSPDRDRFEFALVRAALAADLPLLAICRGMQVLNVALGGTLHQDLPERFGHHEHKRTAGTFVGSEHDVLLTAGSLAARAAGEEHHRSLSHHHQGVDRLGDGLVVTGRSDLDEVPEAIEIPAARFALGVQWHPEADPDSTVVAALVDAARDHAGATVS